MKENVSLNNGEVILGKINTLRSCITGFRESAYPELCRMMQKKYADNVIEALVEELVEVAVVGQEDCAATAQIILSKTYRSVAERKKEDIIKWVFEYTEKNLKDIAIFFLGFNFVLKLRWRELYVPYIESYGESLKNEFGEDYIQFYELEEYLK